MLRRLAEGEVGQGWLVPFWSNSASVAPTTPRPAFCYIHKSFGCKQGCLHQHQAPNTDNNSWLAGPGPEEDFHLLEQVSRALHRCEAKHLLLYSSGRGGETAADRGFSRDQLPAAPILPWFVSVVKTEKQQPTEGNQKVLIAGTGNPGNGAILIAVRTF